MPVRKIKGGYKWGSKGKLYKGKGARRKAVKQGFAALYRQRRKRKRNVGDRTLTLRDIFGK